MPLVPSSDSGREAILFLPGIGAREATDERVLALCSKFALALDEALKDVAATCEVTAKYEAPRSELGDARFFVGTVVATTPSSPIRPAFDIYKVSYLDALMPEWESYTPLRRLLLTCTTTAGASLRILQSMLFWRNRIGKVRMSQVLMAMWIWLSVALYVAILVVSVIGVVAEALRGADAQWGYLRHVLGPGPVRTMLRASALGSALLGFLLPTTFAAAVSTLGANFVRMATYLRIDERRAAVVDRFHALLEHVLEQVDPATQEPRYRAVHVMGYSFGTIIALDALFPRASRVDDIAHPSGPRRVVPRRLQHIEGLVTIGCPADFIRSLWPAYFDERSSGDGTPNHWTNVYCPTDALGSSFREDASQGLPTVKIAGRRPNLNVTYGPAEYSALDFVTLVALRSHDTYFGVAASELGCLRVVAQEVFTERVTTALRPTRPA